MKNYISFIQACFFTAVLAVGYATPAFSAIDTTTLDEASESKASVAHYTFKNIDGEEMTLGQFQGKYVFLEIWAVSCGPCLREMPHFKKLSEDYADQPIEFVAICVENSESAWNKFVKDRQFTGNQWVTPIKAPFLQENRIAGVPTFMLIDPDGNIHARRVKAPSNPELREELDALF